MSAIIDNIHYIHSSTGEKYGLKPEKRRIIGNNTTEYSIDLPIRFEKESEVREFEQQLKMLYDNIEISTDKIRIIALQKGAWAVCGLLPFKGDFKGYVDIVFRPFLSLSYGVSPGCQDCSLRDWSSKKLDWSVFEKECKTAMDTVLKKTILGKKFKEYLKENYKKSDEEADIILKEITPLVND